MLVHGCQVRDNGRSSFNKPVGSESVGPLLVVNTRVCINGCRNVCTAIYSGSVTIVSATAGHCAKSRKSGSRQCAVFSETTSETTTKIMWNHFGPSRFGKSTLWGRTMADLSYSQANAKRRTTILNEYRPEIPCIIQ